MDKIIGSYFKSLYNAFALIAGLRPKKMPPSLNLDSLDELSAAGSSNKVELPPELK